MMMLLLFHGLWKAMNKLSSRKQKVSPISCFFCFVLCSPFYKGYFGLVSASSRWFFAFFFLAPFFFPRIFCYLLPWKFVFFPRIFCYLLPWQLIHRLPETRSLKWLSETYFQLSSFSYFKRYFYLSNVLRCVKIITCFFFSFTHSLLRGIEVSSFWVLIRGSGWKCRIDALKGFKISCATSKACAFGVRPSMSFLTITLLSFFLLDDSPELEEKRSKFFDKHYTVQTRTKEDLFWGFRVIFSLYIGSFLQNQLLNCF